MGKNISLIIYFACLFFLITACGNNQKKEDGTIIASNYPVAFILKELVSEPDKVICITPVGTSEHAFSPKPSDIRFLENAKLIFYVSESLDQWVSKVENKKKMALLPMVNQSLLLHYEHKHGEDEHEHEGGIDPHFWNDPLIVKDLVPNIAVELIKLNPGDSMTIARRAELLRVNLIKLDSELSEMLRPFKDRYVMLFHPSFLYFLKRYDLRYAGSVEEFPGKEPSMQYIAEITRRIREYGLRAIYREPQLPEKSLLPIAAGNDIDILLLDPIGGVDGRNNYFDLIRFNALSIIKGFR